MDWNAYYLAAADELGLGVHQPPIPPPPSIPSPSQQEYQRKCHILVLTLLYLEKIMRVYQQIDLE